MSITARIVILGSDDSLRDEAKLAFDSLGDQAPRFRFVESTNQLFEVLRNQPIDMVLAEFPADPRELNSLVGKIHSAAPTTRVAAILRPQGCLLYTSPSPRDRG